MLNSKLPIKMIVALISFGWINGCVGDDVAMTETVSAENPEKLPSQVKGQNNEFTIDDQGRVKFEAEVIYFQFDDHSLTEEGRSRLAALGDYLSKHPQKSIKVQGHADERGSTEYNLALGQLRTKSVVKYLQDLGIDEQRIGAISYGEEKPAVAGHDEAAWAKNRRADFVILDK